MKFSWHELKRKRNLDKHGFDFAEAIKVFSGPIFTFEDDRMDYGERRWVTMGLLEGVVVVIIHTETKDNIHIISMRKAMKNEQILFFRNLR